MESVLSQFLFYFCGVYYLFVLYFLKLGLLRKKVWCEIVSDFSSWNKMDWWWSTFVQIYSYSFINCLYKGNNCLLLEWTLRYVLPLMENNTVEEKKKAKKDIKMFYVNLLWRCLDKSEHNQNWYKCEGLQHWCSQILCSNVKAHWFWQFWKILSCPVTSP